MSIMDVSNDDEIINYDDQPVLYIEELFDGPQFKYDMRAFIVYDKDTNLFYLYGSRNCKKTQKYINYMLKYDSIDTLFNYLNVAMNTKISKVNVTVYFMSGLTSQDSFEDFLRKRSKRRELFGYDDITLNRKRFIKYMNVLNVADDC